MKERYRIVQLSDLHLTADENGHRLEPKLFGPLKGMNAAFRAIMASALVREADLVLVTGDVTDRGAPEAWDTFWETVEGSKTKGKVIAVPGNHDVCCMGLRLPFKTRDAYRLEDIEKAAAGLSIGQPNLVKLPWAYKANPDTVIIGLNSNNLGNVSLATNAMGELDYFQLDAFARLLWTHRAVPVKIVVLHHSPNIPGCETARKRGGKEYSALERKGHQISQEERRAMRLLCISHRVRLVLHGHLHQSEDRYVGGIRMIGASASTEPVRANGGPGFYPINTFTVYAGGKKVLYNVAKVAVVP